VGEAKFRAVLKERLPVLILQQGRRLRFSEDEFEQQAGAAERSRSSGFRMESAFSLLAAGRAS
jgi:hypothetical protein